MECEYSEDVTFLEISKNPRPGHIYLRQPLGAWGRVSEEGGSAGSLPTDCQAICQALRLFPINKATDAVSKSLRYTVTET